MEVREVRSQTSRWTCPRVEGGRGKDLPGDKNNVFLGSNPSDQVRAKG